MSERFVETSAAQGNTIGTLMGPGDHPERLYNVTPEDIASVRHRLLGGGALGGLAGAALGGYAGNALGHDGWFSSNKDQYRNIGASLGALLGASAGGYGGYRSGVNAISGEDRPYALMPDMAPEGYGALQRMGIRPRY